MCVSAVWCDPSDTPTSVCVSAVWCDPSDTPTSVCVSAVWCDPSDTPTSVCVSAVWCDPSDTPTSVCVSAVWCDPSDTPTSVCVSDVWRDRYTLTMMCHVVSPLWTHRRIVSKYVVKMLPKSQTLQARHAGFRRKHLCGSSAKVTHDDLWGRSMHAQSFHGASRVM